MKKIIAILLCSSFAINAWSQNTAASNSDKIAEQTFRIVKTKKVKKDAPDLIADKIKYRKAKEAVIIRKYCKENDVKFISEDAYLNMNTIQRNEIKNDKNIIVSNSPILFIQENKTLLNK